MRHACAGAEDAVFPRRPKHWMIVVEIRPGQDSAQRQAQAPRDIGRVGDRRRARSPALVSDGRPLAGERASDRQPSRSNAPSHPQCDGSPDGVRVPVLPIVVCRPDSAVHLGVPVVGDRLPRTARPAQKDSMRSPRRRASAARNRDRRGPFRNAAGRHASSSTADGDRTMRAHPGAIVLGSHPAPCCGRPIRASRRRIDHSRQSASASGPLAPVRATHTR